MGRTTANTSHRFEPRGQLIRRSSCRTPLKPPDAHASNNAATVGDHTVGSSHARNSVRSPFAAGPRSKRQNAHVTLKTTTRNHATCFISFVCFVYRGRRPPSWLGVGGWQLPR